LGSPRIAARKLLKPLLQTGRIELMDSEDADAALCAPGLADKPMPAAVPGVGQRGIEYLHQLAVARRKHQTMLNRRKPCKIFGVYQL
jgi:hypothetical protein